MDNLRNFPPNRSDVDGHPFFSIYIDEEYDIPNLTIVQTPDNSLKDLLESNRRKLFGLEPLPETRESILRVRIFLFY